MPVSSDGDMGKPAFSARSSSISSATSRITSSGVSDNRGVGGVIGWGDSSVGGWLGRRLCADPVIVVAGSAGRVRRGLRVVGSRRRGVDGRRRGGWTAGCAAGASVARTCGCTDRAGWPGSSTGPRRTRSQRRMWPRQAATSRRPQSRQRRSHADIRPSSGSALPIAPRLRGVPCRPADARCIPPARCALTPQGNVARNR
jgi:hypothetical protein